MSPTRSYGTRTAGPIRSTALSRKAFRRTPKPSKRHAAPPPSSAYRARPKPSSTRMRTAAGTPKPPSAATGPRPTSRTARRSFPGRSAARSGALQTRDRNELRGCNDPGSAVHRHSASKTRVNALLLHRIRETIRRGSATLFAGKHFEPQRQHGTEPGRMGAVVGVIVAGLRMKQHGEPVAVEHQPRHELGQHLARERDLIHRLRMRPDHFIVPAPQFGLRKFFGDALA